MTKIRRAVAATSMLAVSIVCAQSAVDSYATEKLTQRAQQLAVQGAKKARAAYTSGGLYDVAKLSSDCIADAKAGKASSHFCFGIESVGLVMRKETPTNVNTRTALDWFSSKEMTERAYAHCFSFLGLRSDQACVMAFSTAKTAADTVISGMKPFSGDMVMDPSVADNEDIRKVLESYDPTIGCDRGTSLRKRTCKSKVLGQLYGMLDETYKSRLTPQFGLSASKLRDDQYWWQEKQLRKCSETDDTCVERALVARIAQLCEMPVVSGVKPVNLCEVLRVRSE